VKIVATPEVDPEASSINLGLESRSRPAPLGERLVALSRLLWDRRLTIARFVIVAFVLSVIFSLLMTPVYESSVVLIPSDAGAMEGLGSRLGALSNIAAAAANAGDLFSGASRTPTALFLSILQSRTVADRLIDRFDLMKLYRNPLRGETRKILALKTSFVEDRKTGLITITVQDTDRYRAAKMAQAYVDELNRLNSELNTGAAHREREFLDQRLDEVRKQADSAAQDLASFASTNGVFGVDEQTKGMMEGATRLQGQITALQAQLEGLKQIYSANNIRVRQTEAQISALKQQLSKIRGFAGSSSAAEDSTSNEFPSLSTLPKLGVTYFDLWQRNKIFNTVFEVLTQQLEMARVEEAKELPSVKILDPPSVAEFRTKPQRTRIVIFACLAALFVGVIWVVSRDGWDRIDEDEPLKAFILEIHTNVSRSQYAIWLKGKAHRMGGRLRRHPPESSSDSI
jgi:uncharacterized protein involved in exopolysaccharide biosynthesis